MPMTIVSHNDHCESQWVHEDSSPTPYAKGEGASMMDAQYISPDYDFLCSLDGKETVRATTSWT